MKQYAASNGITVSVHRTRPELGYAIYDSDGTNTLDNAYSHLHTGEMDALREFFRAEEDERLGRWRFDDNITCRTKGAFLHVVNALTGDYSLYWLKTGQRYSIGDYNLDDAAHAYFDAHPEPKPWHDAKPWETWLVTIDGIEHARTLDEDRELRDPGCSENSWMHITDSRITTARRVWPPEVSS